MCVKDLSGTVCVIRRVDERLIHTRTLAHAHVYGTPTCNHRALIHRNRRLAYRIFRRWNITCRFSGAHNKHDIMIARRRFSGRASVMAEVMCHVVYRFFARATRSHKACCAHIALDVYLHIYMYICRDRNEGRVTEKKKKRVNGRGDDKRALKKGLMRQRDDCDRTAGWYRFSVKNGIKMGSEPGPTVGTV